MQKIKNKPIIIKIVLSLDVPSLIKSDDLKICFFLRYRNKERLKNIKKEDIINKLTENEKYYIKLHIANNKNIRSIKTNWDEFENNKKIMKDAETLRF